MGVSFTSPVSTLDLATIVTGWIYRAGELLGNVTITEWHRVSGEGQPSPKWTAQFDHSAPQSASYREKFEIRTSDHRSAIGELTHADIDCRGDDSYLFKWTLTGVGPFSTNWQKRAEIAEAALRVRDGQLADLQKACESFREKLNETLAEDFETLAEAVDDACETLDVRGEDIETLDGEIDTLTTENRSLEKENARLGDEIAKYSLLRDQRAELSKARQMLSRLGYANHNDSGCQHLWDWIEETISRLRASSDVDGNMLDGYVNSLSGYRYLALDLGYPGNAPSDEHKSIADWLRGIVADLRAIKKPAVFHYGSRWACASN